MIDISLDTHYDLYRDYKKGLEFLSNIKDENYSYPDEIVNFHVYTEIKTPKELMVIKSYLATQNLEKTRLIVWSDYSIEYNPLILPFKKYIDLRVYDPYEEAKGTPLEGHWFLGLKDPKYYLQSDLARLLFLWKYGGVWADMDIVFLRDFKPLLDQEYMYMWGSEIEYKVEGACATVLAGKRNSSFTTTLLEQLLITPPRAESTCWGKDMFAQLYKRYKFNILPSTFFNTEWLISCCYPEESVERHQYLFDKPIDDEYYLFEDAFAWHWHNSSKKDMTYTSGSKFGLLESKTNELLKTRGIL